VRRVLLGVVVGLALLAVCFFAWTRYRVAQYHHRESALLTRYHAQYQACTSAGTVAPRCATPIYQACTADAFWGVGEPYTFGLGADVDDSATRCRGAVTG
jgi:hypothetical protein